MAVIPAKRRDFSVGSLGNAPKLSKPPITSGVTDWEAVFCLPTTSRARHLGLRAGILQWQSSYLS